MRFLAFILTLVLLCGCVNQQVQDNGQTINTTSSTIDSTGECVGGSGVDGTCLVNAASRGDYTVCEKLSDRIGRDKCLFEISRTRDPSACNLVSDETGRDLCFRDLSSSTRDVSFCGNITETNLREWCAADDSGEGLDITLCEKIPLTEGGPWETYLAGEVEECFISVAIKERNTEICNSIKGYESQYICIMRLAEETGNISLCENMFNPGWKERCLQQFDDA